MLQRYSDHAANERTFLAWVRTSLAVMAFGFVVERFDLFIAVTAGSASGHAAAPGRHFLGRIMGLLLIALGGAMMPVAIFRFRRTTRDIDDPNARPGPSLRTDMALVSLLVLLGSILAVYLGYVGSRF